MKNLVLIIAGEDGKIDFEKEKITPYTLAQTFFGGYGWPAVIDPKYKLEVNEKISEKIQEEAVEESWDPIKQREARKKGLVTDFPFGTGLKFCHDNESGKNGYLVIVGSDTLKVLDKIGVEYIVKDNL